MHALLITFRSENDHPDLEERFSRHAVALCRVPGLIAKTWLKDGETLGGFHVFESRAEADAYLRGDLVAAIVGEFTGFSIERFEVVDRLSRVTGLRGRPLATE